LGSGILKILSPHEFLHDDVFYIIVFVSDPRKPIGGALLGVSIIDYASVVDYASNDSAWVLTGLPGAYYWQIVL
jgi:hypothetical protein